MTTKHGKVVTYCEHLSPITSDSFLNMCSRWVTLQIKTYLHYHNAFDHKIYQGGDILQRLIIEIQLTRQWDDCLRSRDKLNHISICRSNMYTKLGKLSNYLESIPLLKPNDSLITWQWPLNLTGC